MKKVFVSNETSMVLESMSNIDIDHVLYESFYEVEVPKSFHVHVSGNAKVYGIASVFGDARIYGNAEVYGNARVYDYIRIYGNARVYGSSEVYDDIGYLVTENEMTKVKTAHDRLLDDGWRVVYRDEKTIRYQQVNSFGIRTLIISLYYKTFKIQDDYATLEIAELIVDYLKELKEGSNV